MTPATFRAIRRRLDLSQQATANLLGFADLNQVSRLETGRRTVSPQAALLMRIADAGHLDLIRAAGEAERHPTNAT